MEMANLIIIIGISFIVIGIIWQAGFQFGKLPGDIVIDKGNIKFYFPITTSLLISALLSIIFIIFRMFR
jgi:hypothetical protein